MKTYYVLKNDVIYSDSRIIPKGMIGYQNGEEKAHIILQTIRGQVKVLPANLYKPNQYTPIQSLTEAIDHYFSYKETKKSCHLSICQEIIRDSIQNLELFPDIHADLQACLDLLKYYEDHKHSWLQYSKGEEHFLTHIGHIILSLSKACMQY